MGDLKNTALYESVLAELPQDPPMYLDEYRLPAPFVDGKTFDDFYAQRRELQSFRLMFRKTNGYKDNTRGQVDEFMEAARKSLIDQPISLTAATTPYQLPPDTTHSIMWFRDGMSLEDRAKFLSGLLTDQGLGERDFFVVSSLKSRRTVPQINHSHVFLRSR